WSLGRVIEVAIHDHALRLRYRPRRAPFPLASVASAPTDGVSQRGVGVEEPSKFRDGSEHYEHCRQSDCQFEDLRSSILLKKASNSSQCCGLPSHGSPLICR